ncbi:MAG: hypothetical protein LCH91_05380 [Bacteroidetes bacterium]|nr:hypothetical protein [Bacteroidota bacterium]
MTGLTGKYPQFDKEPTAEELEAESAALQRRAAEKRIAQEAHKKAQLEVRRGQDMDTLTNLRSELEKLNEASKLAPKMSFDDAVKLSERKRKLEEDIEEIENEWGLGAQPQATEAPSAYTISTTKAIWVLVVLFALCSALTGWLGASAIADPFNPVGQSMMKNAPLRALVAFDMTFLTFLVGAFFVWLFFNDLFKLWHNRINSERNLATLLNESPAWAVLFFLLGVFSLVMWVFANYYLTAYA